VVIYVSFKPRHNFQVAARMLLNGDFTFRAACNFNKLRVAKMPHSATLARMTLSGIFERHPSKPTIEAFKNLHAAEPETALNRPSR